MTPNNNQDGWIKHDTFPWITEQHIADLKRFDETTQDDQSYDISKDGIIKLAEAGLVRHLSAGRYQTTDFGIYILTGKYRLGGKSVQGQEAVKVYQAWQRLDCNWIDINEETYKTVALTERRILYTTPPDQTALIATLQNQVTNLIASEAACYKDYAELEALARQILAERWHSSFAWNWADRARSSYVDTMRKVIEKIDQAKAIATKEQSGDKL